MIARSFSAGRRVEARRFIRRHLPTCNFSLQLGSPQRIVRRVRSVLLLVVLAAIGCKRTDAASQNKPTEPRVHVETLKAEERVVPKEVMLTGTLVAFERTE